MTTWHQKHEAEQTPGDRIADVVAAFIGSWTFIVGQAVLMVIWGVANTLQALHGFHFDEYPFVFLNLFMSAEAAFSTPLILMSQNRAANRDRVQAQHDYDVNIAAKNEIEGVTRELARIENEKLDYIVSILEKNSDWPQKTRNESPLKLFTAE
jgi:uncharacterized membrane protein